MAKKKQYWLFKTEPSTYSIDDLEKDVVTEWYGIRNYQVRNFLRDTIQKGDEVFLYHSNAKEIGIVGRGVVASDAYPDTKQFDTKSPYYDPKSKHEKPTWIARDIQFGEKFPRLLSLSELRKTRGLEGMTLLRPGSRLSITPVSLSEWKVILRLATQKESC